jgi:hypothetical protein
LPEAARRLAARYREGPTLDLGAIIVVVPVKRAGRRLQELLAFLAEDEGLLFTPPNVVTEGELPEMLYTPKRPFSSDLVQALAWAQALRDLPAEHLDSLVPHRPAAADALRWLQLGKVLRQLHVELAADGLDFADVQRDGPKLAGFSEQKRWAALAAVQEAYLRLLDKQELWDMQTARLKAIQFREIRTDCDIILLSMVDLNKTLRQMLDQITVRLTAYIVAPENLADRFDGHGCLAASAWRDVLVPLRDEQLCQVDGPEEQADAVLGWLAQMAGRFRSDEVAIGVPDPLLVPHLQRQLEQCATKGRWVEGVRLADTGPYRLLAVAVRFAGGQRYDDLAALMRHPDLEDWLHSALARQAPPRLNALGSSSLAADVREAAMSLPAQLDRFYTRHLPSRVSSSEGLQECRDWPGLGPALQQIEEWLREASGTYPLRSWGNIFGRILAYVYGGRTLDLDTSADEVLHRTIRRILEECDRLNSLPEALDTAPLSAADAFQVALGPLAQESLPPAADAGAVEILGWLELPLDDSRALVVTSFNEGFVPTSTGTDGFLPDCLRRELGLLHNERRYARDAYATSVLCQSREELLMLFARRNTNREPLEPSRLFFACPDDVLVRRAREYFAAPKVPAARRRLLLAPEGPISDESGFKVPEPTKVGDNVKRIPVTRFKAYLACPYRYFLRHVRKLEAVTDAARELDGGAFGTMLHRVLARFGRDPAGPRHSDRERDLFDFLADQLGSLANGAFGGDRRRPAIALQVEQARQRLRAFASCQADLFRAGWRIIYAEDEEHELAANFPVDGEAIELVGRIDRIDFHEATQKVRILDYKTADAAHTPDRTHRKGNDWTDLQLPLYRHLWPHARLNVPDGCTVELGYFNLPEQLDETKVAVANWNDETLAGADNLARKVIRSLCAQAFWPPTRRAPDYSEDFAAICLDNVISGPVLGDGEGGPA